MFSQPGSLNYAAGYLALVRQAIDGGERKTTRGDTAREIFGASLSFNIQGGAIPLIAHKATNYHAVVAELLWFLSGSTNVNDLDARIWNEWADETGDLGPTYGRNWRSWPGRTVTVPSGIGDYEEQQTVDQIAELIAGIHTDPFSRRHIVTAWNPGTVADTKLPPCHILYQFNVSPNADKAGRHWLDLIVYQRSADLGLGVPFNIASYATLAHLVAHFTGTAPRRYDHVMGSAHVYENHIAGLERMLRESPKQQNPYITINADETVNTIDDIKRDHIELHGYDPRPPIKLPVKV